MVAAPLRRQRGTLNVELGTRNKADLAVVVLGAGEGLDRFVRHIEAQAGHIGQIFAVDMNFDRVAIGDVIHFMNIVIG